MTDEQAFAIMRFEIVSAGLNPQTEKQVSDAYLFAWYERVYPLFDEGSEWHKPFASQFEVREDALRELANFLQERWDQGNVPTFHDLEAHYRSREGSRTWDR